MGISFLQISIHRIVVIGERSFLNVLGTNCRDVLIPQRNLRQIVQQNLFGFLILGVGIIGRGGRGTFGENFVDIVIVVVVFVVSAIGAEAQRQIVFDVRIVRGPTRLVWSGQSLVDGGGAQLLLCRI